jgi:hypothetical protein
LSIDIPAIDYLGFIRMKFQTAFIESTGKFIFQVLRLPETATVNQSIISISAKWYLRKVLGHPPIECIMEK